MCACVDVERRTTGLCIKYTEKVKDREGKREGSFVRKEEGGQVETEFCFEQLPS